MDFRYLKCFTEADERLQINFHVSQIFFYMKFFLGFLDKLLLLIYLHVLYVVVYYWKFSIGITRVVGSKEAHWWQACVSGLLYIKAGAVFFWMVLPLVLHIVAVFGGSSFFICAYQALGHNWSLRIHVKSSFVYLKSMEIRWDLAIY